MTDQTPAFFPECSDFQAGTIKASSTQGDHYETTYSTVQNVFVGAHGTASIPSNDDRTSPSLDERHRYGNSRPTSRPAAVSNERSVAPPPSTANIFHRLMSQLMGFFNTNNMSHTLSDARYPRRVRTVSSGSATSSTARSTSSNSADSQSDVITVVRRCRRPATQVTDISVCKVSIEEPDDRYLNTEQLTTPEIFLCSLLGSGKGLPCWQPKPRKPFVGKHGVVPGDVGTYSAEGGFKKIFNLWEDEAAIQDRARLFGEIYRLPEKTITIDHDELSKDDIIASPGTWSDVEYGPDGLTPTRIDFRCGSRQGAVVIPTSAAKLEELTNHTTLRKTLIQSAGLLYLHANAIRLIGDDEPLYIITGCIKSESWALAAYRDPLPPPHDILRLVQRPQIASQISERIPPYAWTKRGTSEARVGASETSQLMDQSLFLRGYKMAFSQDFRAQMDGRQPLDSTVLDSQKGPGSDEHSESSKDSRHGPSDREGRAERGSSDSPMSRSLTGIGAALEGVYLGSFSSPSHKSLHPSDAMADHLLQKTGASVALIHDDDWRFAMEGISLFEGNTDYKPSPQAVVMEAGVAYLQDASLPSNVTEPVFQGRSTGENVLNTSSPTPSIVPTQLTDEDDGAEADERDAILSQLLTKKDLLFEISHDDTSDTSDYGKIEKWLSTSQKMASDPYSPRGQRRRIGGVGRPR
ncbi:hypothetical protein DFP72DRAFT_609206 [Ephemerocybe angulata]|uniref:Uncharacterized protein n=1 Tax=Ephemerocybe angulata TaxID=980116 RepID=A0A8H6HIG4_9AGAR|nr:hypothetical protein DFP72DRAFT_609206 [Tulosesus angulatus]